jgi:hypothetical protein
MSEVTRILSPLSPLSSPAALALVALPLSAACGGVPHAFCELGASDESVCPNTIGEGACVDGGTGGNAGAGGTSAGSGGGGGAGGK